MILLNFLRNSNLIEKKEKKVKEKRLIYLSNEHLKDLLVDDC